MKCICLNVEIYLSKCWTVFVWMLKCICLNVEMYLCKFFNDFGGRHGFVNMSSIMISLKISNITSRDWITTQNQSLYWDKFHIRWEYRDLLYLSKFLNVFVQILKCICQHFEMYLSKFLIVFFSLNFELYLCLFWWNFETQNCHEIHKM